VHCYKASRLGAAIVSAVALRSRGTGFASRFFHYSTSSNIGQVFLVTLLPSLLGSKKLGYKREYSNRADLTV